MMAATAQKRAEMLAQQLVNTEAKVEKADQERRVLIQTLTKRDTRATKSQPAENE